MDSSLIVIPYFMRIVLINKAFMIIDLFNFQKKEYLFSRYMGSSRCPAGGAGGGRLLIYLHRLSNSSLFFSFQRHYIEYVLMPAIK